MDQVVILSAARTPFGRFGGAFHDLSPVELGAVAVREAVARSGLPAGRIELALLGNCMGAATLGQVPGRQVALRAGLPVCLPRDRRQYRLHFGAGGRRVRLRCDSPRASSGRRRRRL